MGYPGRVVVCGVVSLAPFLLLPLRAGALTVLSGYRAALSVLLALRVPLMRFCELSLVSATLP